MRPPRLIACLSMALAACIPSVAQSLPRFNVFPNDATCHCIRTHRETNSVLATETLFGHSILQVFHDKDTGRELFRVPVGWTERGQQDKWWNYGIAAEMDLNGDGRPDFSWYGGDGTSYEMAVFLSSRTGYRRVDLIDLLQQALSRQTHTYVENLGGSRPEPSGDNWQVSSIWIEKEDPGSLFVSANIVNTTGPHPKPISVREKLPAN